ncbi:33674_t:CDS:2, partial [Racocetra persica]
PNRAYDLANCYLCGKELQAARKKSVVKNRNNPSFWGLTIAYKILCLAIATQGFFFRQTSKTSIVAIFDDKMPQGFADKSQASEAPGMVNNILVSKKGQSRLFAVGGKNDRVAATRESGHSLVLRNGRTG